MANKEKQATITQGLKQEIDKLNSRLDMLDERLDNMDSVVSAVVERVMSRPISIGLNCPNCGKNVEIAIIGNQKPSVKRG